MTNLYYLTNRKTTHLLGGLDDFSDWSEIWKDFWKELSLNSKKEITYETKLPISKTNIIKRIDEYILIECQIYDIQADYLKEEWQLSVENECEYDRKKGRHIITEYYQEQERDIVNLERIMRKYKNNSKWGLIHDEDFLKYLDKLSYMDSDLIETYQIIRGFKKTEIYDKIKGLLEYFQSVKGKMYIYYS